MSRIDKVVIGFLFLVVCLYADSMARRIKTLENHMPIWRAESQESVNSLVGSQLQRAFDLIGEFQHRAQNLELRVFGDCHCNPCKCKNCQCWSKEAAAAPPSCSRSKFCPCTPPCMCTECRCGGVLPAPGTPLLTAVVHDGQARIAWLDEDGQRQERTLTEEEFVQLNAKD